MTTDHLVQQGRPIAFGLPMLIEPPPCKDAAIETVDLSQAAYQFPPAPLQFGSSKSALSTRYNAIRAHPIGTHGVSTSSARQHGQSGISHGQFMAPYNHAQPATAVIEHLPPYLQHQQHQHQQQQPRGSTTRLPAHAQSTTTQHAGASTRGLMYPTGRIMFPSTLPVVDLTSEQLHEKYGIPRNAVPVALRRELGQFEDWQSAPVNLERSARYMRAVQTTTSEKHETTLLGYLGFCIRYFTVDPQRVSLTEYAHPKRIAQFVAYLQARGVSKTQVIKHASIARKVNDYLQSGAPSDSPIRQHAVDMDAWLAKLEGQISASMVSVQSKVVPDAQLMWRWNFMLVDKALALVESDMGLLGHITATTAWAVERALVAALVTGCYVPPCRLHLIKTMQHPRHNGRTSCPDPDCIIPGCSGNQLQVLRREPVDGVRHMM